MYKSYDDIIRNLKKMDFQKRIDDLAKKYKDKKIIIYGAGLSSDVIFDKFDTDKLNIVGVSDIKFKDGDEYKGFKTFAPESISSQNPDVVLIAMYEYDIAEDYFEDSLFPQYGKFKYENFIKFSVLELVKSFFGK